MNKTMYLVVYSYVISEYIIIELTDFNSKEHLAMTEPYTHYDVAETALAITKLANNSK